MRDRWLLVPLGVFLLLTGIFAVSSLRFDAGEAIAGYAALVAAVACAFLAWTGRGGP